MSCSKTLDFAVAGAHLSYYWTLDEPGDATKLDSTVHQPWTAANSTLSPPGLFSNGVQLDCTLTFVYPFHRGLINSDDPAFKFPVGSKGMSVWFWVKTTAFAVLGDATFLSFGIECYDPGFTNDSRLAIEVQTRAAGGLDGSVIHNDYDAGMSSQIDFDFHPSLGDWHMLAATVDLVAHTLNFYLDGVLVTSLPDAIAFHVASLGILNLNNSFGGGGGQPLTSVVDELGMSFTGALSAAQVLALYNGGAGMTWPAVTAVVPYP